MPPFAHARPMPEFQEARDALVRAVRAVFPNAKPVPRWAGVEAWGAPRPEAVVDLDAPGTYDPKLTVIGIADRKGGPTIYFLDPGDYFVLETHKKLLADAGLKVGRGCIYHTRKGPLPVDALKELFRRVKERDARAARSAKGAKRAKAAKPKAPASSTVSRMGGPADEVESYLAGLPEPQRRALEKLRAQIKAAAPKATEKISYGMPTFVHEGNLVHMAAFKGHLSFFPGEAGVTMALKDELAGHKLAKGTIQFTPETPLPAALVKKIVKLRVAQNEARAAARKGTEKTKVAKTRTMKRAKKR